MFKDQAKENMLLARNKQRELGDQLANYVKNLENQINLVNSQLQLLHISVLDFKTPDGLKTKRSP